MARFNMSRRLWLECLFLFFALPTLIHLMPFTRGVFIFIWMGAVFCYMVLRKDSSFDRKHLWRWEAVNRQHLKPVLIRFIIGAAILTIGVYVVHPEHLFSLPKERTSLWLMVMLGYPILSVYPQELIFRAYFIHRYHKLFTNREVLFLTNALAFGYAHILFNHWLTMLLSAIGGYLFARTYYSSRSLALACIEHALYGCWIFTVGLGIYFYAGAMR